MASPSAVKAYLACWLQLGKAIDARINAQPDTLKPDSVVSLSALSLEFEQLWNDIKDCAACCYLAGTDESIEDLLSDRWEITNCGRCGMHVPVLESGQVSSGPCPCADMMDAWPNAETLPPRLNAGAIDPTVCRLEQVRDRLLAREVGLSELVSSHLS
ncbi:MAG: hypothetical protein AAFX40_08340 [Cyanobacteria bacterium J06639_1]